MEELIGTLVWRLTWWLLRLLWLPLLVLGVIYYVVIPALIGLAELIVTPAGLLAALLLFFWLWRPTGRGHRHG